LAACTNSLTASGTFKYLGEGKGSAGTGVDSQNRPVTFTISAPLNFHNNPGGI
jgi:hypothetical protein